MFFVASKIVWAPGHAVQRAVAGDDGPGRPWCHQGAAPETAPAGARCRCRCFAGGARAAAGDGAARPHAARARASPACSRRAFPHAPSPTCRLISTVPSCSAARLRADPAGRPQLGEAGETAWGRFSCWLTRGQTSPSSSPGARGPCAPRGVAEADEVARWLASTGFDVTRVAFEDRSRNTAENARFTARMLRGLAPAPSEGGPVPGRARAHIRADVCAHVRAHVCARACARAWPVAAGDLGLPHAARRRRLPGGGLRGRRLPCRPPPPQRGHAPRWRAGLGLLEIGLREGLGLVAYRLAGRSATLYPAP